MANWKLKDLRDDRRRTFLKMCGVAAAAAGIDRSRMLNFLADEGGSGLAEALAQMVAERRGVITSHDAGQLWNDPRSNGSGHAVLMTGIVFNVEGRPETVIINDTGTGRCADFIPAERFFGSLRSSSRANVTDRPVW